MTYWCQVSFAILYLRKQITGGIIVDIIICQSCGMPMTAENLFGTNADGSKNEDYCTHCYQNGAFSQPEETMEQMIESCIPFMVEQDGWTEETSRKHLQEMMPQLKRWKSV